MVFVWASSGVSEKVSEIAFGQGSGVPAGRLQVMRLDYWDFCTEAMLAKAFPAGTPLTTNKPKPMRLLLVLLGLFDLVVSLEYPCKEGTSVEVGVRCNSTDINAMIRSWPGMASGAEIDDLQRVRRCV